MPRLQGKNALVTGASSGIGQAIAIRFAEEGANVAINYRGDAGGAETTRAMAEKAGGRHVTIQSDISREDEVTSMFAKTLDAFGSLDVLVNNAGIQMPTPSHELAAADFDRVIGVNLRGPFLCSREAIRHFLSRKAKGVIVNNSSVHEIIPKPKYLPYSISKGGMENLTKSLAKQYAPKVRVNALAVGAVETSALRPFLSDDIRQKMEAMTPMRRLGTVDDIALAALWLCSPAGGWVTGKVVEVDGGTESTNWPFP